MDEIKLLGIMGDGIVDAVIVDPNWNKSIETPVPDSIGAVAWVQRNPGESDWAFELRALHTADQMTEEMRDNIEEDL
jgi:hypothetical protein